MLWTVPVPPHSPPPGPVERLEVADALLTPLNRGFLRAASGPRKWMSGAVHDDRGRLVAASQRDWAGDPYAPVAADPDEVLVPTRAPSLAGTWHYLGHWTNHFGHFLVEVLPNLWADPARVDGLLAHRSYRGNIRPTRFGAHRPPLEPWQTLLLELAGYGGLPVHVVRQRPQRVERLLVGSRTVLLKSWARPEAVAVWRQVSDAVGDAGPDARVFLSRRRFHEQHPGPRADPQWDALLESRFGAAGFAVVHPETLSISEQVAVVRGAEVLAGSSGSALHLSVFARPGTRVLEVGDKRAASAPLATQQMIDAACGHLTAFVPRRGEARLAEVLARLS